MQTRLRMDSERQADEFLSALRDCTLRIQKQREHDAVEQIVPGNEFTPRSRLGEALVSV